jgi:hypothetical protein
MNKVLNKVDWRPLPLLAVVIIALACLMLPHQLTSVDAGDTTAYYSVNANGQTYGSSIYAQSYEAEPDLISVMATNGLVGYVYKTDLYEAQPVANNPEHAVQIMHYKANRSTDAYILSILEQTGIDLEAARDDVFNYILHNSGLYGTTFPLPQEYAVAIDDFMPSQVSPECVSDALEAARVANLSILPVYESDGVTIIGEFYCY